MHIRKARTEEAERIVALQIDTIRSVNSRDYSPEQIDTWVAHGRVDHTRWLIDDGQCYVCVDGEDLLGFAVIKDNEIRRLFVSRSHLKQGIGSALLEQVESQVAAAGFATVHCESTLTAVGFYKSKGYEEAGEKGRDIGQGQKLAVVSMVRTLSPSARAKAV